MDQALDPFNLLILAIAVVILFRLPSVLGRRTGPERPPIDPFGAKRRTPLARPEEAGGNVITLPRESRVPADKPPPEAGPGKPVWSGFAAENSPTAHGLEKIAGADREFTAEAFLSGA